MTIDRAASDGYKVAADAYERGRPGYPDAAIERLVAELNITPSATVVDIGAGTGRMAAALKRHTRNIVAVEPVESMRRKYQSLHAGMPILAGTAEALPIRDHTMDAAVCAQAFHWFDSQPALREIGRVLKPGGRLGLVWNVRDESYDWVAQLTRIMDPYAGDTPRFRSGKWREAFEAPSDFTPLQNSAMPQVHLGSPSMVIDRIASISFIAALPHLEKQRVLIAVNELIRTHPELAGKDQIEFPYETVLYWCTKKEG